MSPQCICACCVEHRNKIAHGRSGGSCNCDLYEPSERCDCAYCVAALAFASTLGFTRDEATGTPAGTMRGIILDEIASRCGQVALLHPRLLEGIEAAARRIARAADPSPLRYPPAVLDHMESQTDDPAALAEIQRLRGTEREMLLAAVQRGDVDWAAVAVNLRCSEVLAKHFVTWHAEPDYDYSSRPSEWRCTCGKRFGFSDTAIAHVASELAPLIAEWEKSAMATAMKEAADRVAVELGSEIHGHTSTRSVRNWLRERADQIERGDLP